MSWLLDCVAYYGSVNMATLAAYAWDKTAARASWRRVPERRLHLLALAGGWPSAWLAQRILHHKTRKQAFRRRFWLTVALHVGLIGLGLAIMAAYRWTGPA